MMTVEELAVANEYRATVAELCRILRCRPEEIVDKIKSLQADLESLIVEGNELKLSMAALQK